MSKVNHRHGQHGFTLIEFMIAGMLGLIILGGVLHILVNSKQTFLLQGAIADVQDSGRFALKFINDDYQRLAWTTGRKRELEEGLVSGSDACLTGDGVTPARGDCLSFTFEGSADCLGQDSRNNQRLIVNNYRLDNLKPQADGVVLGQLVCEGGDATSPAGSRQTGVLVDNVESFQVLYGVDGPDSDTQADFYIPASANLDRESVVSLRVGLVVASEANALEQPRSYSADELKVLNEAGYTANDRRLRRVYVQTISLPNRALHPVE